MCFASPTWNSARRINGGTLKKVFDQISRDVPLGFDQHREDRAPAGVAISFKPALDAILGKLNKVKDADYKSKLLSFTPGKLLDLYRSLISPFNPPTNR